MAFNEKEYHKQYNKQYYLKNKEKHREYNKQYYLKNKEKINQQHKLYKEAHKKEINQKAKQYRLLHPEKEKQRHKKYYQNHKEKYNLYSKQYRNTHKALHTYLSRISQWKKSGINITWQQYAMLWLKQNRKCAICGKPILLFGIRKDTAQVDHDHKTSKIRGLLCFKCNIKVGHVEKFLNGEMNNFVEYLNKFKDKNEILSQTS